jgi:hypothetical protein
MLGTFCGDDDDGQEVLEMEIGNFVGMQRETWRLLESLVGLGDLLKSCRGFVEL